MTATSVRELGSRVMIDFVSFGIDKKSRCQGKKEIECSLYVKFFLKREMYVNQFIHTVYSIFSVSITDSFF